MKIPMSWLKEYVDVDCDISEFSDRMTMSGSKVEAVEHIGKDITNVVIGKIVKIEKHPDADKLVVTQVDIGKEEPVQIVTGATNVFEGAFVPVALHKAMIAGGTKITKGKIRGVASNGMMCSVEELGFTRNDYPEAPEEGIYIFENEQVLGSNPLKVLEMLEDVVEFELTSNRPDCYSVLGMAREASATFGKTLKYTNVELKENAEGDISKMISVEIENSELCPRYIARVVKNVKIEPSPQWLRRRLTASGIRPINNIVDITNYVMLELGQPMHAFDIDSIAQRKIIVRNAKEGEVFTTLDGTERILDTNMLVISDPEKAVAIAGVMGGENSKISGTAEAVLFESANFNGSNVRLTSKKLNLRTDSSSKFEKGLDPNLAEFAVNRAVHLVEMLGCGEVVPNMVDCYPNRRDQWKVKYSVDRINSLIGISLTETEMIDHLEKLEIKSDGKEATIPTFRADLIREADIAEEIARIYGYDKIPQTLPRASTAGKKSTEQKIEDIIKNTCVSLGLNEALLYSFESPKVFDKLNLQEDSPLRRIIKISNPLGEDFSVMRSTALNGILSSLSTNYNRRNEKAMLFEIGKVYVSDILPLESLPQEISMLTIGMYGEKDFYDIKGIVEEITNVLNIEVSFRAKTDIDSLHSGRSAVVLCGEEEMGYLGEIHPQVLDNYEIGTKAYVAVLNVEMLMRLAKLDVKYKPLPKYPASERDIAMLVKADVFVADIEAVIRRSAGKILENVNLFDVYQGKQIEEGYKSVAYAIRFRASDRTLTEEEVSTSMNKILKGLEETVGAKLRV